MGGDGGSDRISIDYADLMTEQQKLVLDQMLRGAVSAVQGFQLGTPYPGPKKKGYGTSIFNIAGSGTPYYGPGRDDPRNGPKDDPFDPVELNRGMPPPGGATPPPNVQNILQNMEAFFQGRQGQGGGGMPFNPAMRHGSTAMPNFYTQPFTSPYTQLLTGNFPRGG